jgi:hypothetical protein
MKLVMFKASATQQDSFTHFPAEVNDRIPKAVSTFQPREVKALVGDYLDECRRLGILEVRIVHGKGTGALRRTVHAVLERRPDVVGYGLAG